MTQCTVSCQANMIMPEITTAVVWYRNGGHGIGDKWED